MSMFTYIAFPRVPDLSMLKRRAEPSELNSENSNDTGKSEQQQNKILIFPRRFEDDKQNLQDFWNFAFQGISVYDQGNIRFNHVFNNQYVYSFSGRLEDCRT